MVFEVASARSLDAIDSALKEASARHKFGILGVHDLREKMHEKGVEFSSDCLVYEVCNPQQAKRVLENDAAISTALPCRISVYGRPGAYKIATLVPTALLQAFGAVGIESVAKEVENDLLAIIREAA